MEILSCGDSTWMTMIRIVALWHPLLFGFIYLFHYSSSDPLFVFVSTPCVAQCSWRFSALVVADRFDQSLYSARTPVATLSLQRARFPSASDSAAPHSGILRGTIMSSQHQRRIFSPLLRSAAISSDHNTQRGGKSNDSWWLHTQPSTVFTLDCLFTPIWLKKMTILWCSFSSFLGVDFMRPPQYNEGGDKSQAQCLYN